MSFFLTEKKKKKIVMPNFCHQNKVTYQSLFCIRFNYDFVLIYNCSVILLMRIYYRVYKAK